MYGKLTTRLLILIAVMILSVGCAQQPISSIDQTTQIKNDFATGLGVMVDYVTDGERTFIILDVDNPNRKSLEIWFNQTYAGIGAETIRKRRLITSSNSQIQQTIRASKLEEGVKEIIVFEILDTKGNVLIKSEPIENDGPVVKDTYSGDNVVE